MRPEDIYKIESVGAIELSPLADQLCYALVKLQNNGYVSQLYIVPTSGEAPPKRLTDGDGDSNPAFSPDGAKIAFLRNLGGKRQLAIVAADGGTVDIATDFDLGIGSSVTFRHARSACTPVWSPDGSKIAFVARVDLRENPASSYRRATKLRYRMDSQGFVQDRPSQVFVYDLSSQQCTQISQIPWDHWDIAWHPDGRSIVAASVRGEDYDLNESQVLVAISLDGDTRILSDGLNTVGIPVVTNDGKTVVYVGVDLPEDDLLDARARNVGLFAIEFEADAQAAKRLTAPEPYDLDDGRVRPLIATPAGIYSNVLNRGAVELHLFDTSGTSRALIAGKRQVHDYDVKNGVVAAVVADMLSAGSIVILEGGEERVLVDISTSLQGVALHSMQEVHTTSQDGYPVHGWLLTPAGPGPHPLIFCIHGGPDAQYGYQLFDEAQVYTSAGYAVLMSNPRGSAGYGEAHARAIRGRLGTIDCDDLLAILSAVRGYDEIDTDNVFVMGGSYGGYMTAWLAAHHSELFNAAICERGVYEWRTCNLTSDVGTSLASMVGLDMDQWEKQCALRNIANTTIPVMILHWEGDLRAPFNQAQQLFSALRCAKKEVELIIFPGGSHNASRNGVPSQRIERFKLILDWFDQRKR